MNQRPKLLLPKLLELMRRDGLQRDRLPALEMAERCYFESSSDTDHRSVKRVHEAAEAMLAAGTFHLPAEVVLIEDPAAFGRQFYLCSENADGIEVWGATLLRFAGKSILQLFEKQQWIATGAGRVAQPDYRVSLNTSLIAVKEFLVLLASSECDLEEVPDRKFPFTVVRRRDDQQVANADGAEEEQSPSNSLRQINTARQNAVKAAQPPVTNGVQYADFVDDARRGRVKVRLADGRLNSVPAYRELNRLAIPVYDFGHMFDPGNTAYIGRERHDEIAANTPDDIDPPEDACAFMFRFGRDEMVWLARVERTATDVIVQTFIYAEPERFWQMVGLPVQTPDMESLGEDIAFHVSVASLLLAYWRHNVEVREAAASPRAMRINEEFNTKGVPSLPPTKVIHVLDKRVRFVGPRRGHHASPIGHDRTLSIYTVSDKPVSYTHPKTGKQVTYQRKPKVVQINRTIGVNGGRKSGHPGAINRGQPPVLYEVRL